MCTNLITIDVFRRKSFTVRKIITVTVIHVIISNIISILITVIVRNAAIIRKTNFVREFITVNVVTIIMLQILLELLL